MTKKCEVCGMVRKITIECGRCKATICLNDIDVRMGLCANCIVEEYNEKYKEKIMAYSVVN